MFFRKMTKWHVLTVYNQGGNDFIVLVRRNKKTGMLHFRTKKVTPLFWCSYNFNNMMFDVREGFKRVLSDE